MEQKNTFGLRRQIFLLTDGAVYNTDEIVQLVANKSLETNSRVHTFGSGAST